MMPSTVAPSPAQSVSSDIAHNGTIPLAQAQASSSKITRGHSCAECARRKVRCDKQKPCSNCVKANSSCIPSASQAPRRKRRNPTELDLVSRVRRYEELLSAHGVNLDDDNRSRSPTAAFVEQPAKPLGKLYQEKGNSQYVENALWENLEDEIRPQTAFPNSSEDGESGEANLFPDPGPFLIGHAPTTRDLKHLHPPPVAMFRLWQTFLTNVNPLIKIFHAPTVQEMILDASSNLGDTPRTTEALMFSIYLLATVSLSNEECDSMFSESRDSLIRKYAHASQQALMNARYLKSLNLTSLQSYVIYLLAYRKYCDPHSFWILTGAAMRIAQRLGLHKDGTSHGLTPFDTEIRRRTWWQIAFVDGFASKISGAGIPQYLTTFETELPSNVSDSDLNLNMKGFPESRDGASEMIFCSLRYEVAQALRSIHEKGPKPSGFGQSLVSTGHLEDVSPEAMAEKDRRIDALESRMYDKYLRFLDASIPLHSLSLYMAKSIICVMRLMAHHPRHYPDKGANIPQGERDMLFDQSLKMLEYDTIVHSNKLCVRFLWHIHVHFQIDSFIYLLSELRYRASGKTAERAWYLVEEAYAYRPEMITDHKNILYFALGSLTLKAWTNRELAHVSYQIPSPQFILSLRSQRHDVGPAMSSGTQSEPSLSKRAVDEPAPGYSNERTADFSPHVGEQWEIPIAEITPMDWEYWQTLLDGDLPAYSMDIAPKWE